MSFFSLAPFFIAAFFAAATLPLSIRLAVPLGAMDIPDGRRKAHARPTPRLGGLALFFALLFALLPSLLASPSPLLGALLAGGALVAALGISDDIFSLSPALKLFAEVFAALLPVFFGLVPKGLSFGTASLSLPTWLGIPLTVLWILTLTNAFNMIDGLNGLCASQIILSSLFLALVFKAPLALAPAGAAFGFLPYNRGRARTFLGDGGALLFGYALALFSFGLQGDSFALATPLLFFLPLLDLLWVFLLRLYKRKNPFSADASHLHHRLRRCGFSAGGAVLLLACLSLFGFAAFLLFFSAEAPLFSLVVLLFSALFLALLFW